MKNKQTLDYLVQLSQNHCFFIARFLNMSVNVLNSLEGINHVQNMLFRDKTKLNHILDKKKLYKQLLATLLQKLFLFHQHLILLNAQMAFLLFLLLYYFLEMFPYNMDILPYRTSRLDISTFYLNDSFFGGYF